MLNVSEDGFSFRAVNPVQPKGNIRFALAIDGTRLEGTGELEWFGENGRVGGLRFTEVSKEFRREIRRLLTKSRPLAGSGRAFISAAAAPVETREEPRSDLKAELPKAEPVLPLDEQPERNIEAPPTAAISADTADKTRWMEDVQPRKRRAQAPPMEGPEPTKMLLRVAPEVEEQEPPLAPPAVSNAGKLEIEKETTPSTGLPGLHFGQSKAVVLPHQTNPEMPEESAVGRAFPIAAERREGRALWLNAVDREKSKKLATPDVVQTGSVPRSRLGRVAAVAIVVAAMVVVLSEGVFSFRREVGESLIWLGENLAGETKPVEPGRPVGVATLPVTPAVNPPARSPVADAYANPVPAKPPPIQDAPNTPANSSKLTAAGAAPEEPGQAELAVAQRILGGKNGSRDITGAMKLLWVSVQKGNSTAVLTLSELYVRGQVVTKNCAQARVLLTAAAKEGSAVAKGRLEQLSEEGCP